MKHIQGKTARITGADCETKAPGQRHRHVGAATPTRRVATAEGRTRRAVFRATPGADGSVSHRSGVNGKQWMG